MMGIRPYQLLLFLATVACSTGNVVLGDATATPQPGEQAPVVRLYYDRDGSLYPAPLISVSMPSDSLQDMRSDFTLKGHFERTFGHPGGSVWDQVLDTLRLESRARIGGSWEAIQDSLVQRAVTTIREAAREDATVRTLVVLIHGFNNEPGAAEATYAAVRSRILQDQLDADSVAFLQLYWDGLQNAVGIPVWGEAQFNFPLVGLAFRRVLGALPGNIPVRIITHSSGGPLIANALWDASAPIEWNSETRSWPAYRRYWKQRDAITGRYAIPTHPDLRIGMIVPAMPGTTFANFQPDIGGPERIVIGVNPRDAAITKFGYLLVGWQFWSPCEQAGSTCLSARPEDYCESVEPKLRKDPDTDGFLIDFSNPRSGREPLTLWLLDSHSVPAYLARADMSRFLSLVFEDQPEEEDDRHEWCGTTP